VEDIDDIRKVCVFHAEKRSKQGYRPMLGFIASNLKRGYDRFRERMLRVLRNIQSKYLYTRRLRLKNLIQRIYINEITLSLLKHL
jgi:hypothetical protein